MTQYTALSRYKDNASDWIITCATLFVLFFDGLNWIFFEMINRKKTNYAKANKLVSVLQKVENYAVEEKIINLNKDCYLVTPAMGQVCYFHHTLMTLSIYVILLKDPYTLKTYFLISLQAHVEVPLFCSALYLYEWISNFDLLALLYAKDND